MRQAFTPTPPFTVSADESPGAVIAGEIAEAIAQTDPYGGKVSFACALANISRIVNNHLYSPSPLPNHVGVDLINTIRRREFVLILTGLQMFHKSALAQLNIDRVLAKRSRRTLPEAAKIDVRNIIRRKLWAPDISKDDRHDLFEELAAKLFDEQAIGDLRRSERGVPIVFVIADTEKPGIEIGLCSFFTTRILTEMPENQKAAGRA